jgi:hypothetical protein
MEKVNFAANDQFIIKMNYQNNLGETSILASTPTPQSEGRQRKRKSKWSSGVINKPKKKKTIEHKDQAPGDAAETDTTVLDTSLMETSVKSPSGKSPVKSPPKGVSPKVCK